MKILLAEDDTRLGSLLQHMFQQEKYLIDWVQTGDLVYEYILKTQYDIIILDWLMPGEDGIEVCKRLRQSKYFSGILMLTARDTTDDRITGLEAGADDYLPKPFEFKELLARMKAIIRRSRGVWQQSEDTFIVADIEMDRQTRRVKRGEREIFLTVKEFRLLELLAQHYGKILPREIILDRVWGMEKDVSINNLDALLRLLRKKIDNSDQPSLIHNIRGVGFKMEAGDVK